MQENLTIVTFFIHAIGMRSAGYTGYNGSRSSATVSEDIHSNGNALPMGPIRASQSSADAYPPLQIPTSADNASNQHNQSEGSRSVYSGSEQGSDYDLEAELDAQSAGDSTMLFFQRWGKYHYAGVAGMLLLLHIVRSVYSASPRSDGVSSKKQPIEYNLPSFKGYFLTANEDNELNQGRRETTLRTRKHMRRLWFLYESA